MERLRKERGEKYEPDMPECDADYLIGYLYEIGPTLAAGMSAGPITQGEIRHWQDNTGIDLQPWEARFLRRLSAEYVAESRRAERRDCPAPWRAGEHKPVVSDTQAAIRALVQL